VYPRHATLAVLTLTAALGSFGCVGEIGSQTDKPGGSDPLLPGGGDTEKKPQGDPAFELPHEQPQLLPFWVRLSRVASVLDVTTEDPLLSDLRANRLNLGDYDHGQGVQPNRMWTPARMALWAKSLKIVCSSDKMKQLYPTLPGDADKLIEKAWGRIATEDDISAIEGAVSSIDGDAKYQATCLAVLSAAEFVVQ
jgi:hypothetical protein